jgi:hypothetical protein
VRRAVFGVLLVAPSPFTVAELIAEMEVCGHAELVQDDDAPALVRGALDTLGAEAVEAVEVVSQLEPVMRYFLR